MSKRKRGKRVRKMGLRKFLRNWNDFSAKTHFGIVLENFCRIEVRVRKILSEENREEELDLEGFLSKNAKGRKGIGLEIICPSKKGEGE